MSYQKHNFEAGAVLFASQLNDMDNQIEFLSNQGSSFSDDFKTALLNCFENVAWINENGQTYYDALYDSLYPDNMWFITNALTGCVTSNNATSILKNNSYVATITANEGYTLDGATVSITMGGNDVTNLYYSSGSINIPNVTGDLVITVAAVSNVVSISAVFTQGSAIIYDTDSLDTLRQYLVVTATYSDSTTATVTDYTLSGTLGEGTRTITVSYGGESDTFDVVCTVNGWLYHFEQSLASSGSEDFGFLGNCSYDTGHNGTGYSMYNDTEAAYATGITAPDLSGDFTVSFWAKTLVTKNGQGLSAYTGGSAGSALSSLGTALLVKSGWSVTSENVNHSNNGCRIASWSNSKISTRLVNSASTAGRNFECTPPSSFDSTTWHHYALTRKDGTVRFFVDGEVIYTVSTTAALRFPSQCALGGYYDTSNAMVTPTANKSWYDDLYVAEFCKWDSDFDPQSISY